MGAVGDVKLPLEPHTHIETGRYMLPNRENMAAILNGQQLAPKELLELPRRSLVDNEWRLSASLQLRAVLRARKM